MRRLGKHLLVTVTSWMILGFVAASASADEPSATLRVMSYNLRYASDQPPNAWAERRVAARAMLESSVPDLFGTQEALYRQVKDLEADLPTYDWIGLGRDGGSRGEFMAVFYRRERLEPQEFDHFWLSDTPEVIGSTTWGNTNRRMVTWARFLDRATGQQFYFFNTHFDHLIQAAREKSAALVWSRVEGLKTDLPVILVGDFNATAEKNPAYAALVAEGRFVDTWPTASERGPEVGTFHDYRGPQAGGERIDWILSRGAVRCRRAEVITFAHEGQYPSDHFPVLAELEWGGP